LDASVVDLDVEALVEQLQRLRVFALLQGLRIRINGFGFGVEDLRIRVEG